MFWVQWVYAISVLTLSLQYRHLIPATVARTSARDWMYKHPLIACKHICQTHQWPTKLANQSYGQFWGHSCSYALETGWQSGMRSCIMSGLPTHLGFELNVGLYLPMSLYDQDIQFLHQSPPRGWSTGRSNMRGCPVEIIVIVIFIDHIYVIWNYKYKI